MPGDAFEAFCRAGSRTDRPIRPNRPSERPLAGFWAQSRRFTPFHPEVLTYLRGPDTGLFSAARLDGERERERESKYFKELTEVEREMT